MVTLEDGGINITSYHPPTDADSPLPEHAELVQVQYTGTIFNSSEIIDNTFKEDGSHGQNFSFYVGARQVSDLPTLPCVRKPHDHTQCRGAV